MGAFRFYGGSDSRVLAHRAAARRLELPLARSAKIMNSRRRRVYVRAKAGGQPTLDPFIPGSTGILSTNTSAPGKPPTYDYGEANLRASSGN